MQVCHHCPVSLINDTKGVEVVKGLVLLLEDYRKQAEIEQQVTTTPKVCCVLEYPLSAAMRQN